MESLHLQMLDDGTPENERMRMDPDHWYELNLTNSSLFANLAPEKVAGMEQLVPGRLFTTRMPRDLNDSTQTDGKDFQDKVERNNLKVVFCLTEPEEFVKYAGIDDLMEFYKQDCGLIVYNRAIEDFQIPTEGDLVDNILDITFHLARGHNCLIHCAGVLEEQEWLWQQSFKILGFMTYSLEFVRSKVHTLKPLNKSFS